VRSHDQSDRLVEEVQQAAQAGEALRVIGLGSKAFLTGEPPDQPAAASGRWLSTADHAGIVDYRPEELVITARTGTLLTDVERVLAEHGQMLPFEPPRFRSGGTLGGAIAAGLAGPGRPWRGAVRDSVLGVELVNGRGERLAFGGQVMKNVAGYDVSRLQVGAFGTLGLLLAVSVKVLPRPGAERTLVFDVDVAHALARVRRWAREPWPTTATAWVDGCLAVRLSGAEPAVADAAARLGGTTLADPAWWTMLRDHRHEFFGRVGGRGDGRVLWRAIVPAGAPAVRGTDELVTWAGAERWNWREVGDSGPAIEAAAHGGHARPFDATFGRRDGPHLPAAERRLSGRLRDAFDPQRLFNRHLSEVAEPADAH
jgi:glycolate oxidase FAD binding subunit